LGHDVSFKSLGLVSFATDSVSGLVRGTVRFLHGFVALPRFATFGLASACPMNEV
jgi:hypothetical protein